MDELSNYFSLEALAAIVSAVLTAVALFASWRGWRQRELRREDVHAWANEAIVAVKSVQLIAAQKALRLTRTEERERLRQLVLDTAILVERGRLLFRNRRHGRFGEEKQAAYRGKRPELLDQLVLAHQIACQLPDADAEQRRRMAVVAREANRRFVTLVQREVGRVRTAAASSRRRGDGIGLEWRMRQVDLESDAE